MTYKTRVSRRWVTNLLEKDLESYVLNVAHEYVARAICLHSSAVIYIMGHGLLCLSLPFEPDRKHVIVQSPETYCIAITWWAWRKAPTFPKPQALHTLDTKHPAWLEYITPRGFWCCSILRLCRIYNINHIPMYSLKGLLNPKKLGFKSLFLSAHVPSALRGDPRNDYPTKTWESQRAKRHRFRVLGFERFRVYELEV